MKDGEMGVLEIKLDQGQVKASKLESVSGSEFIRLCSVRDVFAPRTIRIRTRALGELELQG